MMLSLTLATNVVFAGNKNQNDITNGKSVERGTGKINHEDGCAPPEQSGNYWVFLPVALPPGWANEWEGGPCCPSNTYLAVSAYPLPNQCCNPPDEGPMGVPGNHCLCFQIRGYPIPNALPPT